MRFGDFPLLPTEAGPQAHQVDMVALLVLGVCFTIAFGVCAVMVGLCLRYRKGRDVDRSRPPERSMKFEVVAITIPLILSVAMFWVGAKAYYNLYVPDPKAMEIEVVGEQWLWTIRHPSGRREINTLHLPMGVKIRLKMISQDVIHSFYLPQFRNKHDVLPGRYTILAIEPTRTGRYELVCSEFCGTDHSLMRGEVIVMTPAEYAAWCAQDGSASPEDRGRLLYRRLACAGCHEYQAGKAVAAAPLLDGIMGETVAFEDGGSTVVDETYLRESILRPRAHVVAGFEPLMPTYEEQLSENDLMDLIAYLRARSSPPPDLLGAPSQEGTP